MDGLLHWIGVAVVLLIIAFGLVGFWRGLSLKPTDRPVVLPKGFGAGRLGNGFRPGSPWECCRWLRSVRDTPCWGHR
jgi:hypothetical protein